MLLISDSDILHVQLPPGGLSTTPRNLGDTKELAGLRVMKSLVSDSDLSSASIYETEAV